jgi:ribosomal protein S18 acetylase RimI-like enzyme
MLERRHWPALEAENQAELLAYLGTASCAERYHSPEITWVITGVDSNDYNGVIWARLNTAEVEHRLPSLVQQFRERGLPALWHLDPATQPPDLGDRLGQLGCLRLQPGVCMAAPLNALSDTLPALPGLTVERVTSRAGLSDWIGVWNHDGDEQTALRELLYADLVLDGAQPLRHYLARLDGEPVGVSQLFLGRRAAGLYSVAVLPAFRRRGIGSALTLLPFRHAQALGYTVGVLGPSPEGQPMYERLGFTLFQSPFIGYALWVEP